MRPTYSPISPSTSSWTEEIITTSSVKLVHPGTAPERIQTITAGESTLEVAMVEDHLVELAIASRHGFEPFIHQDWQIALLESFRGPAPVRAWLKVDSGMHRLGFAPAAVPAAVARLAACVAVAKPPALATRSRSTSR